MSLFFKLNSYFRYAIKKANTVRLIIDKISPAITPPNTRLSRLAFIREIGAKIK